MIMKDGSMYIGPSFLVCMINIRINDILKYKEQFLAEERK